MAETKSWQTKIANQDITLQSGKMAEQAHGSILARAGDTVILATVVISETERAGVDFFPLMVDYEERLYAAGKIKGSRWVKREGRPSDDAILTARLVDRSIRPLFPKDFRRDIQVIITVLSYDDENDPVTLAILAASAALKQSGAPFTGPIAAARIGKVDGQLVVNPLRQDLEQSELDLIVSVSPDRVMMIEADGQESSESELLDAIKLALDSCQAALAIQNSIDQRPLEITAQPLSPGENIANLEKTEQAVSAFAEVKVTAALKETDRDKRQKLLADLERETLQRLAEGFSAELVKNALAHLVETQVRQKILTGDQRPDGRSLEQLREISCEVGLLPRTHGSALFSRGQTQSLTIATLGAPGEVQMIETMEEEGEKSFMHHYNFPPFSTAEVKPIRGASRREIGHGALAERSLKRMLPAKEDFPYTIRLVSEILSSNGSSSMAATCASTLALMDAGVPIKSPVAGIAIGLITDEQDIKKYKVLTDIQGIEDFSGDMDFKVAGTKKGVTAIQMDTKIKGLTFEIIEQAFKQAKTAREEILGLIEKTIPEPRKDLSVYAPRITTIKIDPTRIGDIIGPGGKMINKIITESGGREFVSIDIEEDGTVMVSSSNPEMSKKALGLIEEIVKEIEVSEIYQGEVSQIIIDRNNSSKEIGAVVKFLGNKEGMVHISEVDNKRINKVSDVLKVGQKVRVKVIGVDRERGRVQLSIKALLVNESN